MYERERQRTTGTESIPIAIPIAIWMKRSPRYRLLRTGYCLPQSRDVPAIAVPVACLCWLMAFRVWLKGNALEPGVVGRPLLLLLRP